MENLLSYTNILEDIQQFKKSGKYSGKEFNLLDTPSHKYFKILFYFGSQPEFDDSTESSSGLLAPTWEEISNISGEKDTNNLYTSDYSKLDYYNYNSAWSYLMLNDEKERADKLEHFVTLLSDISSKSPWYFSTVGGLQEALERKAIDDGKFEHSSKKLTITCIPDAYDNRIGTLLELYRDVTWSWIHKREVIPSNLRKFDMAIYIFESPLKGWTDFKINSGNEEHTINSIIDLDFDKQFKPSYKMIEFHDCEFGYNSIKSGYNELNNQTGFSPTFTIEISYNDCYEISYNNVMIKTIGDVILTDMLNNHALQGDYISKVQETSIKQKEYVAERIKMRASSVMPDKQNLAEVDIRFNKEKHYTKDPVKKKSLAEKIAEQTVGHASAFIKGKINRALMGNLYGFSLTKLGSQLGDALSGNLIKTGMSALEYAKMIEKNRSNKNKESASGNIYLVETEEGTVEESVPAYVAANGNIYSDETVPAYVAANGNIYSDETVPAYVAANGNIYSDETVPAYVAANGNIYSDETVPTYVAANGNIYSDETVPNIFTKSKSLGNIFNKSTIANN